MFSKKQNKVLNVMFSNADLQKITSDGSAVEKAFVRVFHSEDGKKVLAWLQQQTQSRIFNANTTEAELRHAEGARALFGTITRMIERGKRS